MFLIVTNSSLVLIECALSVASASLIFCNSPANLSLSWEYIIRSFSFKSTSCFSLIISSLICSSWKNGFNFSTIESHTGHLLSFNCNFSASFSFSFSDTIWVVISCIFLITSLSSSSTFSSFLSKSVFSFSSSKQFLQSSILRSFSWISCWIPWIVSFTYLTSSFFCNSNWFILSLFGVSISSFFSNSSSSLCVSFFCNSNWFFSGSTSFISYWFFSKSFVKISICVSSYPKSVLIFSRNSFVTFFIDSDAISSLSIPIIALSNSLNSFGFALIIAFNSPCWTIDAIFNFSKFSPIVFSTCSVIDSPNCFLSPAAISTLLLFVVSENIADKLPLVSIFLTVSYCLSFIENSIFA